MKPIKVIFVCLGNICRSPIGEGVFQHLVKEKGLEDHFIIDSAGTAAYHVGNLPDERMRQTAYSHGILLESKARQFVKSDLDEFDYILAMDRSNLRNIKSLNTTNDTLDHVQLMRNFDLQKDSDDVPDPYYGGILGFEEVYQIVYRSCVQFLDQVIRDHQL